MKNLCVVTFVSSKKGLYYMLEKQLNDAGIDFYTVDDQAGSGNLFEFCSTDNKVKQLKYVIDTFSDYKNVVIVDGWDTLFFGTKEEVLSCIPKYNVLISGCKNCFPNPTIAKHIPDQSTPWKYADFGGVAGSIDNLKILTEVLEYNCNLSKLNYGQDVLNVVLTSTDNIGDVPFAVDSDTILFYSMLEDEGELINYNGKPLNKVTDQIPSFIHFNGDSPQTQFLKEYNLYTKPIPVMNNDIDYVFCLPGDPSSGMQSMNMFLTIFTLMQKGKSIVIRNTYSCDIYMVRNTCLANKSFELEQLPFEDYCKDYKKIIWVDSDNYVTAEQILKLDECDEDIVAGWCTQVPRDIKLCGKFTKANCGLMENIDKPWTMRHFLCGSIPYIKRNDKELVEVDFVGMGLTMIKKGVFESIGFPWFRMWTNEYETCGTKMVDFVSDDKGFCLRVKRKGFKIFIDPSVQIGHEKLTIH